MMSSLSNGVNQPASVSCKRPVPRRRRAAILRHPQEGDVVEPAGVILGDLRTGIPRPVIDDEHVKDGCLQAAFCATALSNARAMFASSL